MFEISHSFYLACPRLLLVLSLAAPSIAGLAPSPPSLAKPRKEQEDGRTTGPPSEAGPAFPLLGIERLGRPLAGPAFSPQGLNDWLAFGLSLRSPHRGIDRLARFRAELAFSLRATGVVGPSRGV